MIESFKDCKFGRGDIAEHIIEPLLSTSSEKSLNITINGPYGYGKTTFLEMLTGFLESKGYEVIFFNAWETDFISDPFIALYTEIFRDKESTADENKFVKNILKTTIFGSAKILSNLLPPVLNNIADKGIDTISEILDNETNVVLNEYRELKKDILDFKNFLKNYRKNEKPLVFIIDELDRCKPTYSIALLERIKHLFNIEGIHFIFGIDKVQLSYAVKKLYGTEIDSEGYLRRFFDIEYSLPQPDYKILLNEKFKNNEFDGFLDHRDFKNHVSKLLTKFNFSIRDYEKMAIRLKLVNYEQYYENFNSRDTITIRVLLTILKIKQEILYNKIKNRQIQSEIILDKVRVNCDTTYEENFIKEYTYFIKSYLDYEYTNTDKITLSEDIKHPNYENKSIQDPICRIEAYETMKNIFKAIELIGKINV